MARTAWALAPSRSPIGTRAGPPHSRPGALDLSGVYHGGAVESGRLGNRLDLGSRGKRCCRSWSSLPGKCPPSYRSVPTTPVHCCTWGKQPVRGLPGAREGLFRSHILRVVVRTGGGTVLGDRAIARSFEGSSTIFFVYDHFSYNYPSFHELNRVQLALVLVLALR